MTGANASNPAQSPLCAGSYGEWGAGASWANGPLFRINKRGAGGGKCSVFGKIKAIETGMLNVARLESAFRISAINKQKCEMANNPVISV
jgi:hypothetical protein